MKFTNKIIYLSVSAALTAMTGQASASGFQLMEQNASGLGNAYAGQAAAAENASTIFFNPAGMTRLPGRQVSGAINLIRPSSEFTNSGGSTAPGGLPSPGGNGGDIGDWAAVPNAYMSWQIDPKWWVGVGVSVPFGLATEYDRGWVGRFQSQKAEIKTIDINPSIAYKVNDVVSLGAGISFQHAEVEVNRSSFIGVEALSKLEMDDNNFGFNLGAMFNLSPATRIGLAYRSAIKHDLQGTATVTGIPGIGTAATPISATAKVPDTLTWGISHQMDPKWQLLGDVTLTRWSTIKQVPVVAGSTWAFGAAGSQVARFDFEFKDTYRIGVGANYQMRDDFMLKLGVAYDKSPVTDQHRLATLPDNDRTWLAIGGKYQASKQLTLDFGYAYLFVKDAPINRPGGLGVGGQGNVIGNYSDPSVHIISAQATYSF
jgi:long-chain fatty acid transport protein